MTQTSPHPSHREAAEHFAAEARHLTEMTVLHEDGVYRHIRFKAPESGFYWFDLITWPGSLCFKGDMGTYVFSRDTDMLSFFSTARDINPGYWSEKVQAGETKAYSPERFRKHVEQALSDAVESGFLPYQITSLRRAVERDVLADGIPEHEHTAREAVRDFSWNTWTFSDAWEWDLNDFKHHFLWACYAIRWGVNRYLVEKGEVQPVPVLAIPPVPRTPAPRHTPADAGLLSIKPVPVTAQPRPEFL